MSDYFKIDKFPYVDGLGYVMFGGAGELGGLVSYLLVICDDVRSGQGSVIVGVVFIALSTLFFFFSKHSVSDEKRRGRLNSFKGGDAMRNLFNYNTCASLSSAFPFPLIDLPSLSSFFCWIFFLLTYTSGVSFLHFSCLSSFILFTPFLLSL